jgi:hypothetical protein
MKFPTNEFNKVTIPKNYPPGEHSATCGTLLKIDFVPETLPTGIDIMQQTCHKQRGK